MHTVHNARVLLALTRAETAARLGIGAAVALVAWLLLLGLLAVVTRARRPDPAPEAMDLPGDEPPAVVCMLADGWDVGREAVPATLLDLAARKFVAIEPAGLDRFVVRLRKVAAGDLTPYEEQVLDHVRRLASSDGTIPCEALTTGPEEDSKNWWKNFEAAVVRDARDRGLSRPRWSRWMLIALGVVALAPAMLAAGALIAMPPQENASSEDDNPIGAFIGLTALVWVPLMGIPRSMRADRDTPAGREVAARWYGLREHLEGSGGFEDAPPASVVIWDRHLAYGAALGVAPGAVRALPLGSESDKVAWSHYTGHWRMVRIAYPKRFPPGWGRHPALATAIGVAGLLGGLFVARIFFPPMADAASRLFDSTGDDQGFEPLDLLGVALLGLPSLAVAVLLVRSALMLVAAVPDLFVVREMEGVVLRIRRREKDSYLALDDGTDPEIRAWRVEPAVLDGAGLVQGSLARATVRPRLGHVLRLGQIPEADRGG
jgi:hypothetical protein